MRSDRDLRSSDSGHAEGVAMLKFDFVVPFYEQNTTPATCILLQLKKKNGDPDYMV